MALAREIIELYIAVVPHARRTWPVETAGMNDYQVIEFVAYYSI